MRRAMKKESGFAKYLRRTLQKDEPGRLMFFAEVMKAPLASQLRLLRHFRGLSQMAVAKRMKLGQGEIARLEGSGSNPRADTLERMAKGLGARVEILPEQVLPFMTAQQIRAQGDEYFGHVTARAR